MSNTAVQDQDSLSVARSKEGRSKQTGDHIASLQQLGIVLGLRVW